LEIIQDFIRRADANTSRKIETCGILAGNEVNNTLIIDTLIIPKQEGKADMCHMTDEIELFQT
jgi:STAM-binding protein